MKPTKNLSMCPIGTEVTSFLYGKGYIKGYTNTTIRVAFDSLPQGDRIVKYTPSGLLIDSSGRDSTINRDLFVGKDVTFHTAGEARTPMLCPICKRDHYENLHPYNGQEWYFTDTKPACLFYNLYFQHKDQAIAKYITFCTAMHAASK